VPVLAHLFPPPTSPHVAPIGFSHINFRGIFRFPIDQYIDRLLPPDRPHLALSA
jgi:hypothetical protein